eukprot:scaffold3334_cov369-Prasinococcus_capsulatus_cf.AAC.20
MLRPGRPWTWPSLRRCHRHSTSEGTARNPRGAIRKGWSGSFQAGLDPTSQRSSVQPLVRAKRSIRGAALRQSPHQDAPVPSSSLPTNRTTGRGRPCSVCWAAQKVARSTRSGCTSPNKPRTNSGDVPQLAGALGQPGAPARGVAPCRIRPC